MKIKHGDILKHVEDVMQLQVQIKERDKRIEDLEKGVEDLEQYSRCNDVVVTLDQTPLIRSCGDR